uniref:AlNc14C4281G13381 protein n=1 Tax=Albugo laibachii Nc14 TaxID=890382 RepID=F0X2Z8_9STRA|nr:AlNc14C4281G13381 [Albugo laibachii Nc14]|eukprot:CCA28459.1 AlNc14C4281G13381 [Albugo laibachii Nc14]
MLSTLNAQALENSSSICDMAHTTSSMLCTRGILELMSPRLAKIQAFAIPLKKVCILMMFVKRSTVRKC